MLLTPEQVEEVVKIISSKHIHFLADQVGIELLTPAELSTIEESGIDLKTLSKYGVVDNAFKFGILSDSFSEAKLKKLSYDQFKEFLSQGQGIPLSKQEKFALNHVKQRAYSDIKGLGNKIINDFQTTLIEENQKQRKRFEKIIKETAADTILSRGSISSMVSDLGHKTGDWSRDFGRISDYVLHEAFDHGRAEAISSKFGVDALVYKEVYPGACKHCLRLYTTAGIGSEPIIFKLSDLLSNGTNIGRKAADWLAVVGATHPWCRCTLRRVPEGYSWDTKTNSFSIPVEYVNKVERKSKVKVTFN